MQSLLKSPPAELLPDRTRPTFFAVNELLLELLYVAQGYAKIDLESLLIILCVGDATMRPFMLTSTQETLPAEEAIDEALRGSISRRTVADKTGLPRETVRRKVDELIQTGLLIVDGEGRLRSAPMLGDPDLQTAIDAMHAAVGHYQRRLQSFRLGA